MEPPAIELNELSGYYQKHFSATKKQNDTIPMFRKRVDNNLYSLYPQGRELISYLIENLKKYIDENDLQNNISSDERKKRILPFLKSCEYMKNTNVLTYDNISFWVDFFAFFFKSQSKKSLSIEYALNLLENPKTHDLSAHGYEIITILYNFHYSNIELEFLEPLCFKINPWTVLAVNKLKIDNSKITYFKIKQMIDSLINQEVFKHISSSRKMALSFSLGKIDFCRCMQLQIIINLYQSLADTVYTSSKGKTTTERLRLFFEKYHNENYAIGNESRTMLSKYYSLHNKLAYYNKNLIFEYLTNFSLPAFDFLMKNKNLITRPSGRLFYENMSELLSSTQKTRKGHLMYWLEYYFGIYSTYILKNKKDINLLQNADDISPLLRIYLAIFINYYNDAKKWFGEDAWYKNIDDLTSTIVNIEDMCSELLKDYLLTTYTAEEICNAILNCDGKLNLTGPLVYDLSDLFDNLDFDYTSSEKSYRIKLKAYNTKPEEDNNRILKNIAEVIEKRLKQNELDKTESQ